MGFNSGLKGLNDRHWSWEINASGWLIYSNVWWCTDLQTVSSPSVYFFPISYRRQNTKLSVVVPICTVSIAVREMCKCCGTFLNVIQIPIPCLFLDALLSFRKATVSFVKSVCLFLGFVSPCIIIHPNKSTNQMHQSFRFIARRSNTAYHVSAILLPIIRSVDRPRLTTLLPPRSNGKRVAATAVYKLLMMGMRMPETCWAVFERRAINLRGWCIWLFDLFESVCLSVCMEKFLPGDAC
jgi:hypothetical protein